MGTRKCILVSSVLVICLISGYSAHSLGNGRNAKILEDPIVPQASSYESISRIDSNVAALQDDSDRSLSVEHNMMLYRTVFTLSLKLLTLYIVVKLLTNGLASAGIIRPSRPVLYPGQPNMLYTVDVNHNPGLALAGQGTSLAAGNTGAGVLTATSTGAAAGASTGTAPGVIANVPASYGSYLTAASTNSRPSYLVPGGLPIPRFRFGFGGPRHPPMRRPPYMMPLHPVSHHNMGEETHYIDTHSHLFVMPDGSQARVPISQTASLQQAKPASPAVQVAAATSSAASGSSSSASASQQDSKASASSADSQTAERDPIETVNVSTSSSSSTIAERRLSNVFSEKSSARLHQLQNQPYNDWNHYSPGA